MYHLLQRIQRISLSTVQRENWRHTGFDTNSHLTVWGSSDVNPKAEDLYEYLMAQMLLVQREGTGLKFHNT